MNRGMTLALVLAGLVGSGLAQPGMELTILRPYKSLTDGGGPILALSWFTPKLTPVPGYDELGLLWLPPWEGKPNANPHSEGVQEMAGAYAGHLFLPGQGWIRPGIEFGWTWEKAVNLDSQGESHTKEQFSFYYGAKVQVFCLTFLISNKGVGGGINFSL